MSVCIAIILNKNKNRNLPRLISLAIKGNVRHFDLYRDGSGKTIKQIRKELSTIRELLLQANERRITIICQDFRDVIRVIDLPIDFREYYVYDQHMPRIESDECYESDIAQNTIIINTMMTTKIKEYQNILANSAVVYADMEANGVYYNYVKVHPKWSQKTYTGRSKTLEFNLQGLNTQDIVYSAFSQENDILLLFDWVCADIRIASIMSDDDILKSSFIDSDPYTYLANLLNKANKTDEDGEVIRFTRDECKLVLLKAINSLDYNSIVFEGAYPKLGDWIFKLSQRDKMYTILGRQFEINEHKNILSVFNGVMQGSVAHAMQIVMRKLWERMGSKLVCDIHDSIVLSCKNDPIDIKSTIQQVSDIMLRPFDGLLDIDYVFPVKVSIGRRWKSYVHYKTFYG